MTSAPQTPLWNPDMDTMPWPMLQERLVRDFVVMLDRLRENEEWRGRLRGVAQVRAIEDLVAVPFTTKEDLRSTQSTIDPERPLGPYQLAPTDQLRQITSSSGTTGTPVFFGLTGPDLRRWRSAIGNAYRTAGVGPGSIVAHTTGMAIVAGGLPYADGIRAAGGALAWVGGQTLPRMVTALERTRANVLVSTASFAAHFAERCAEILERPTSDLAVRTIIAGGEPGAGVPHIRNAIMDGWSATRVSEMMGIGDVLPALWAECHVGQGMHFTAAPDVLVELIDPETLGHVPWEQGVTGEAVYTTLSREASAVVRFRSRDQLLVTATECACGRTSPTVRCVGRTDDMLIFESTKVYPTSIRDVVLEVATQHLTGLMRVRKTSLDQVRFDEPIPLEVELRDDAHPDAAASALKAAEEQVRRRLRVHVSVEPFPRGVLPVSDYKNALTYAIGD
ncbi:phenylacetate--CoA ligase family protein [Microbacterium lushaniae]|uniref:Phenylacetate--CoA ligase n=1 Tax=Microbacterium lushaniae TaxID=2614639 RepID=A0A5J6L4C6_9MICO|nr:phenylacetate--CoA ligase [Microbacterium lushaniae]QEW03202.1 phenylacetate--CoA ligase [Microbacterium lushaniae]